MSFPVFLHKNADNFICFVGVCVFLTGCLGRSSDVKDQREALHLPSADEVANHNLLGIAFLRNGRTDEAIAEFHTALRLDPNAAAPHMNLGIALHESKEDLDGAIEEYRAAIGLGPNDPSAHYNLGNALRDKGNLDEAIEEYHIALHLAPRFQEAHINLGIVLLDKGDFDGAIDEYRTVLRLNPNRPDVHFHLGLALQRKGNFDEAQAEYRTTLLLDPNTIGKLEEILRKTPDTPLNRRKISRIREKLAILMSISEY